MTRTDDTLLVLRSLDSADSEVDVRSPRARADLARILGSDPDLAGGPVPRPRRRGVRAAAVAGGLAAVTAAAVALPSMAGGDRAFASWTATPSPMPPQEQADAFEACREEMQSTEMRSSGNSVNDFASELREAEGAVAERRGEWTLVVLVGDRGFSAMCVNHGSGPLFSEAMFGNVGRPVNYTAPGPRDVVAFSLGTGAHNGNELSIADGNVGSEVTGVAYHSRRHGAVRATVSGGHFALWMPGDELEHAHRGAEFEVTYRDGTTRTVTLTS